MAKRHRKRPAIYAKDFYRWIANGNLEVQQVGRTPTYILKEGHPVWQTWLTRPKNGIVTKNAVSTYLRRGEFFVPSWINVPAWEIKYRNLPEIHLRAYGIRKFRGKYFRLCFMQVEDLDHAKRQMNYILNRYLDETTLMINDLMELFSELSRREDIIERIQPRQTGLEFLINKTRLELNALRDMLKSYLNSPVFQPKADSEIARLTLIGYLPKISQRLRQIHMRPFGTKLKYAARSVDRAVMHLRNHHFGSAKARIQSALTNIPEISKDELN
ncbi:MAG: hypothetical protein UT15_C0004G0002 [Berkelbacteria bacterium GW2011_GWA1_39_10]|uniref:Uncharacterized protein n=1 Tax=Berkelbacteria bacterium GW2011_GWA1_39_10 TaxID=1618332 RepID=A0A0G0NY87_9BACT|nr:MAG: hypothetical protein UT15_C0004G0002 [Berkelbacteria bacterium GW2011_GWA1_39_10]